eukprot:scaffold109732_cov25-Cyclotella_meneghiniana.AAC.1
MVNGFISTYIFYLGLWHGLRAQAQAYHSVQTADRPIYYSISRNTVRVNLEEQIGMRMTFWKEL